MTTYLSLSDQQIDYCIRAISMIVFKSRHRHLTDTECLVLSSALQRKTYESIVDEFFFDYGHICVLATKIFKILSKRYNEPITKTNFIWFCKRTFLCHSNSVLTDE